MYASDAYTLISIISGFIAVFSLLALLDIRTELKKLRKDLGDRQR